MARAPAQLDATVALQGLRAAVSGEVLMAADPGYDQARTVWNALIDRRPAVIVRATSPQDVSAAVRFASSEGLAVSVRGGGHNVAGHAVYDGGVMIDLSAMRGVSVDPIARRALVQGGAIWRDVDAATQAFGLATPGGLISGTGVGGLTLSGGIGWLRSRHGLTIDNLASVVVVLADAPRPVLGPEGRRRQLRDCRNVRIRTASDRSPGRLLGASLSNRGRRRSDPILARLSGGQG